MIVQRKKRIRKGNGIQTKRHRFSGYNDNIKSKRCLCLDDGEQWERFISLFYIIGTIPKRELGGRRRRQRR